MKMVSRFAALVAAGLLSLAPAAAQKVSSLPTAAPLSGSEKIPASQGTNCTTNGTPSCTSVAVTPAQLRTFVTGQLGTAATANIGTSGATVPLLNGVNIWSASQQVGVSSGSSISLLTGADPVIQTYRSGNAADEKYFRQLTVGNQLRFDLVDDAYSVGNPWLTVGRSGATPNAIVLYGTSLNFSGGPLAVSGSVKGAGLVSTGSVTLTNVPTYATDAAAGAGGLTAGQVYRTSDGAGGFSLKIKG